MVNLPEQGLLLRIFVGESDKRDGRPLYEVIVEEARRRGLAGATVLRGVMGFGASSRIHTTKILRLSEDLPMVIEIVDEADKINAFLPDLDGMVQEGLVTLERVQIILYRDGRIES
jgi:PII-like signaling protein